MPHLAESMGNTPHSGIRTMLGLVRAHPGCVSLVNGEPNFTTPAHIIDGAAAAARAGGTGYAPSAGFDSLRRALVDKLRERNAIAANVDEVIVTTGATGGLFTSLMQVLSPGEEILLPDPGWSNYPAIAHVLGATSRYYRADADGAGTLDLEEIERLVTPATRAVLVNSPGNPTGVVYSAETLAGLGEVAARHDLWILSDECYDEIVFDAPRVSTAAVAPCERVISVFTFSKTYAMTGWRVGYVHAPSDLAAALERAQEPVVSSASSISQAAAEVALRGPQDAVAVMRDEYARRLGYASARLDDSKVRYLTPHGAFYLMIDISSTGMSSWSFATSLLEQDGVGVVPGLAFGAAGEGYVRASLAVSPDELATGLDQIVEAVQRWS